MRRRRDDSARRRRGRRPDHPRHLTVIAALLPMAFVTGLMGPYMSPIPINSSMGMLLSLAIAFVVTPWLALRLLHHHRQGANAAPASADKLGERLARFFTWVMTPFLRARCRPAQPLAAGGRHRRCDPAGHRAGAAATGGAEDAAVRQQVGVPGRARHADRHAGRAHGRRAARTVGGSRERCPKSPTTRPMPGCRRRSTSTAWCGSTTCAAAARSGTFRSICSTSTNAAARATRLRRRCARRSMRSRAATTPT